jgi:hypothetical protein
MSRSIVIREVLSNDNIINTIVNLDDISSYRYLKKENRLEFISNQKIVKYTFTDIRDYDYRFIDENIKKVLNNMVDYVV